VTDERVARPRVRTVFLGSGAFAVPAFHALVAHPDVEVVAVVTAPPRPAGRRLDPSPTPVEGAARERGIGSILTPARLRAPESISAILALDPDLAVLADYGQIVPGALLEMRHGALNLHPSLLPRHRGATPVPAAILAGDIETGVSLMRMDAGLDSGPIVAQVRRALDGTEATPSLEAELAIAAAALLADHLAPWLRAELEARPQSAEGVTLTRPRTREDGRLDPTRDAVALERQIRAYQPWPGSFVDTAQGRLVIWSASVAAGKPAGPATTAGAGAGAGLASAPGTFDLEGLSVGRGERLVLHEVQPAGGKRMSWVAYVRGRPGIVGATVLPGGA
jgi:methionyl-tRNA formyltransferase